MCYFNFFIGRLPSHLTGNLIKKKKLYLAYNLDHVHVHHINVIKSHVV